MNSIPKIDITDEMIERARWSNEHLSPETIREALTAALTEPTPLQERIERELEEMFDGGGFSARDMARDLFPIIAAEARNLAAENCPNCGTDQVE